MPMRSQEVVGSVATAAKVLVVEDDSEMRSLVQEMLRDEGYQAVGTSDTLSAFMYLIGEGADVLVTDWKMPALNGLDLLESVRRCLPDLPVVFVTAFADRDLERRALAGGASSFLAKPFQRGELVEHVRSALALARARKENRGRRQRSSRRGDPTC